MRKWFEKAHGAIIWTIAIAFVAGIVVWSISSYVSSRKGSVKYNLEDSVAYLTKDGTALSEEYWIFPWEVEDSYSKALSYYQISDVDPVFEEPMLKTSILNDLIETKTILYYAQVNKISPTKDEINQELDKQVADIEKNEQLLDYIKQKYGSVENYKKTIEPEVVKYLTIAKVRDTIASVSDDEMKNYYSENREDLMNKYDQANVDFVSFSSQASANDFINEAMNTGFYQAATNMSLSVQNYDGFKRGIIDKKFEDSIFGSTNTIVGPIPLGSNFFVFNVKDVKTVDTFEKFTLSQGYQDVLNQLKSDKFRKAIDEFKKSENVSSEIIDPVYKTWNQVLTNSGTSLLNVYKKLNEMVFDESTKVTVKLDAPVEIKAAFVTLVEKMQSATELTNDAVYKQILDDASKESKLVLESIYNDYPESFIAAKKMKTLYPKRTDVLYNYYTKLYLKIKPYVEYGMLQSVVNDFIDLYGGLNTLSEATDISLDWKAEVLYDLYEINKMLKDATTAEQYLEKLREATPTYMDFEAAFNELEMMKNSTSTSN